MAPDDAMAQAVEEAEARGVAREIQQDVLKEYLETWTPEARQHGNAQSQPPSSARIPQQAVPRAPRQYSAVHPSVAAAPVVKWARHQPPHDSAAAQTTDDRSGGAARNNQPVPSEAVGTRQGSRHRSRRCAHSCGS